MLYCFDLENQAVHLRQECIDLFPNDFIALVKSYGFAVSKEQAFLSFLAENDGLLENIQAIYERRLQQVLLLAYHTEKAQLMLLITDNLEDLADIGEQGSVLSYLRSYGLDDKTLCSDCYGQMACSSCLVTLKAGAVKNPEVLPEEMDMFDIDASIINKTNKRLGCQVKLAVNQPLALCIGNID